MSDRSSASRTTARSASATAGSASAGSSGVSAASNTATTSSICPAAAHAASSASPSRPGSVPAGSRRSAIVGDRAAQQRPDAAGAEADAERPPGAPQRALEGAVRRAVEPGAPVLLEDDVRGRVGERRLLVGVAAAQVPLHAPEPRDVRRQRGGRLPAPQRERALGRRSQHAPRGAGDRAAGHRGSNSRRRLQDAVLAIGADRQDAALRRPCSGTGELTGLRGEASYRHDETGARLTLSFTL